MDKKNLGKNKKIILIGTLTLVVGFILGLFVSHLFMQREIVALEGELLAATGAQNNTPITTNVITSTNVSTTTAAANLIDANQIKVRVNDGEVQWFDGTYWNPVAAVEELQQQDKFYLAEESLAAFEQQYSEAAIAATESDDAGDSANNTTEYADLNVGKIKKDPPKITTQPTQPDAPVASDSTGDGSTDTGENSGGSSGGGTTTTPAPSTSTTTPSTPSAPNTGTTTPSTPDTGTTTPSTPAETPSDSNTGDGENMEWSDDYL